VGILRFECCPLVLLALALVEQQRDQCVILHALNLAVCPSHHQLGIDGGDFLRAQPILPAVLFIRVCEVVWCSAPKMLLGEPSPRVIRHFSRKFTEEATEPTSK
jgi:hypothetical protein